MNFGFAFFLPILFLAFATFSWPKRRDTDWTAARRRNIERRAYNERMGIR